MEVQSEHEALGIVHEYVIECVNQGIKGGEHHDQMNQRHGSAQTRPCFVEKETHLLHSIACSNLSVTSRAVRRVCMQRVELHLIMAAAVEGLAASSRSARTCTCSNPIT